MLGGRLVELVLGFVEVEDPEPYLGFAEVEDPEGELYFGFDDGVVRVGELYFGFDAELLLGLGAEYLGFEGVEGREGELYFGFDEPKLLLLLPPKLLLGGLAKPSMHSERDNSPTIVTKRHFLNITSSSISGLVGSDPLSLAITIVVI